MKLIWRQKVGKPECPYIVRWVADFGPFSIRLHQWLRSDDQRHFHDHSWDFVTLVLRGGYTDLSPEGAQRMTPGTIAYRAAEHQHTVKVDKGGCLTLLFCWKERREFGFWVKGKFRRRNKYFFEHGHHPCET
jgi:hypothetical protein